MYNTRFDKLSMETLEIVQDTYRERVQLAAEWAHRDPDVGRVQLVAAQQDLFELDTLIDSRY